MKNVSVRDSESSKPVWEMYICWKLVNVDVPSDKKLLFNIKYWVQFAAGWAGLGWAGLGWPGLGWAGLVRSSYNFVGELCCCFCWSLVAAWSSLSNTLTLWAKMAEPELVLGEHFKVRTWLSQTTARWVWENTGEHARDIADINI